MTRAHDWVVRGLLTVMAAGTATGCSDYMETEVTAAKEPDPHVERAIELYDAAAQAVAEVTGRSQAERACVRLKALGIEFSTNQQKLRDNVAFRDHPEWATRIAEAKQRLANALSALTAKDPESARIITQALGGLPFGF